MNCYYTGNTNLPVSGIWKQYNVPFKYLWPLVLVTHNQSNLLNQSFQTLLNCMDCLYNWGQTNSIKVRNINVSDFIWFLSYLKKKKKDWSQNLGCLLTVHAKLNKDGKLNIDIFWGYLITYIMQKNLNLKGIFGLS